MAHFINCTACGKQYNEDAFEECPFCGFKPNCETVICPNRLCGKEISTKFDNCPFCHTPLNKNKRTAEEVINEHKHKEELIIEQKEEILKEAVRKRYNIDGDISDEQYKQLIEIYKHEVDEITLNEAKNEKRNNNNGKKIPTGGIIGIIVCLITVLILIFSTGGSSSTKIAQNIRTADQWVTYCNSEPNIHRCLNVFDKIDLSTQCLIWRELTNIVANLRYDDEKQGIKADAWSYLLIYFTNTAKYPNGKVFLDELKRRGIYETLESTYASIVAGGRADAIIERYKNE